MTGLGMGTGPKIAKESEVQDFGRTSVARVTWVMVLAAVGSHFITSRENLPRMEPKESRAERRPQTGSHYITCIPETSTNPGLFTYVSQDISVSLKTVGSSFCDMQ